MGIELFYIKGKETEDFLKMKRHIGHNVECVQYGAGVNISIECKDCNEVIKTIDHPTFSLLDGHVGFSFVGYIVKLENGDEVKIIEEDKENGKVKYKKDDEEFWAMYCEIYPLP